MGGLVLEVQVALARQNLLMGMRRVRVTLLAVHQREDMRRRGLREEMNVECMRLVHHKRTLSVRKRVLARKDTGNNRRTAETRNQVDRKNKLTLYLYDTVCLWILLVARMNCTDVFIFIVDRFEGQIIERRACTTYSATVGEYDLGRWFFPLITPVYPRT